ncbi:uncharacterized protein LOC128986463 [Macrosteles quadrilineatus]|uniref:uncharacterized protein LOC128986463 n=1 Tax=Macrosteles quadrilineatus TaxID=74068 RepID=UPI0023E123A1|nr:uncharacterized protein LOC128986463 [Macrosteles quadrilineatus]
MWGLVHVAALFSALSCVSALGDIPKCDPDITSKSAQATGIIPSIQKNGQYSYVVVSTDEATFMGKDVKCIGINMADSSTAQVSYKLTNILFGFASVPVFKMKFPVKEDNGVLIQENGKEYKLYVMYMSDDGVIFTYRCCDTCTGTEPNVGIAVADTLKTSAATLTAFNAAKDKMKELKLDSAVSELSHCT